MKPFLCVNMTDNKNNETPNGNEFMTHKTPDYMLGEFYKLLDKYNKIVKIKSLKVLNGIFVFFVIVTLIIGRGILGATAETPLKQCYANAPWLFWLCGTCLIIAIFVFIYARISARKNFESDEAELYEKSIEANTRTIYTTFLNVPDSAKDIDILSFNYKIKKGKICPNEKLMKNTPFENTSFKIHKDNENLFLSVIEGKYVIPLSSIKQLNEVKEKGTIPLWNKDEEYNKGFYKQFKITHNDGNYSFKPYYILTFEINGEETGIYIPPYDIHIIENLLNITAEK